MAKQMMYGHCPSGIDPRTFSPDYELCTEQEIQNWKDDCAAWDRGENPPVPPAGYWADFPDGTQMHVLAPRYGIGMYEYDDGEPEKDEADDYDPDELDDWGETTNNDELSEFAEYEDDLP